MDYILSLCDLIDFINLTIIKQFSKLLLSILHLMRFCVIEISRQPTGIARWKKESACTIIKP